MSLIEEHLRMVFGIGGASDVGVEATIAARLKTFCGGGFLNAGPDLSRCRNRAGERQQYCRGECRVHFLDPRAYNDFVALHFISAQLSGFPFYLRSYPSSNFYPRVRAEVKTRNKFSMNVRRPLNLVLWRVISAQ